jgi:hypothetical protein
MIYDQDNRSVDSHAMQARNYSEVSKMLNQVLSPHESISFSFNYFLSFVGTYMIGERIKTGGEEA